MILINYLIFNIHRNIIYIKCSNLKFAVNKNFPAIFAKKVFVNNNKNVLFIFFSAHTHTDRDTLKLISSLWF